MVSYVLIDFFAVSYFTYSCIYAAACGVTIAAPYVYVWLSKLMKVRGILKLCVGLTVLSFALMAAFGTASPVLFLVAFVPYALAEGIVRPMAFVVLLDQPDDRVGAASMPAPMAAPNTGTKNKRPNSTPQNRPHTAEVPTLEPGVTTSYLPSARRATTATDCRLTMRFLSRSRIFW